MIYLDHNASTPLDERVEEAMLPYGAAFYGNPSGLYRIGRLARAAIDVARQQVAALVGTGASSVIFTGGGTEANNLAIKGLGFSLPPGTLIAGPTEHPAVLEPLRFLGRHGYFLNLLPVDRSGTPELDGFDALAGADFRFAALMLANNETGVVHDVAALAERVRVRGGYLHVDAVQAAGKIPVDFTATGAHTLALSAHKLNGPKGVGALIAERSLPLEPLLHGGGQERGLRSGTENVAGIVGFGRAAELAMEELEQRRADGRALRRRLEAGLAGLPGVTVFAAETLRLPNTVQFALAGFQGETLVMNLDRLGFCVSSGSACASGGGEPSPVLLAMGVEPDTAVGAVRVSFGRGNTETDVDRLLEALRTLSG